MTPPPSPPPSQPLGIAGRLTSATITSPLTPLFLLAAFVFGLVALISLPREEEPQISVPMVDIHVRADGLKAADAVKLITEPLETIVKGISDVDHVYSQSSDDHVVVTARFVVGTSSDSAVLRVHDKVRANLDRIPVGVPEPMIVGRGIDDVAILALTLSPDPAFADRVTANDLTRIARELRTEIAKISDVGLTYLVGETPEMLRIDPDPARLALYGVTLQQLAGKVAGANTAFPVGQVRDGGEQIALLAGETLRSPEDIGKLLLTTRDDRPVYVRDVADIAFSTDREQLLVSTVTKSEDGVTRVPAVTLAVAKRAGSNAVLVAEEVLHRVESLEGTLIPEGIHIEVTRDYGESANEKANELLYHLGLATVSIIALVWLSIGWREAIVVALVIPVTILLTLFASWLMGYTLNRVSLFALIFSIGILVDDAIVVIENIARHWAMGDGRSRRQAAIDAVAEVGNPTIIATLTVVAALLPMLFVSGMMGPYMSPIPANASAAMIFSFFVAVTVTPWLMLKTAGGAAQGHHDDSQGGTLGRIYRAVAGPILATKARSWLLIAVVVVLTFGSMALFYTQDVTVKLLPFDNKSELSVVIDLPEGSSVEATDAIAQQVAAIVLDLPEVLSVQTHAGTAAPFNFNGLVRHSYLRALPEQGDVAINLVAKDRPRPVQPSDRAGYSRASGGAAGKLRRKLEGGRAAPRPAGSGDAAGRDLRARPRNPPRRGGARRAGVPRRAFRGRCRQFLWRAGPAAAHHRFDRRCRVLPGAGGGRARHHRDPEPGSDGGLFASRRRAPADSDPARASHRRADPGRGFPDHADPGQRPARRPQRRRTGRRGRGLRGTRLVPDLPPQRPRRRDGHRRAGRHVRGAALRDAGGAEGDRCPGLERSAETGDLAAWPARGRIPSDPALGRGMGGYLGHLPRHGGGLRCGATGYLHPGRGAVRLVQGAAGDPDAGAADLHRHHRSATGCSAPPSPRPR